MLAPNAARATPAATGRDPQIDQLGGLINPRNITKPQSSASLRWKSEGKGGSRLLLGNRCFGRIVPDSRYRGMWRSVMPNGSLSDMANIAWAKHAVIMQACRELEYEQATRHPQKCPEKWGVPEAAAPPMRSRPDFDRMEGGRP
jgi:hypothetical protein